LVGIFGWYILVAIAPECTRILFVYTLQGRWQPGYVKVNVVYLKTLIFKANININPLALNIIN